MANKETASGYINRTSKEYAIYTCENRAIPKVADGLKDGQRKMLWTIRNKSEKVKTISLAGESIQTGLFLHGDGPAADSINALAGPYVNNVPFLKGIGTFGTKINPRSFAAPRYTYVKRYSATQQIVFPDLDLVPLKDNYDGSTKEPVHFLPIVPTVLLNGISGIAVGWSSEILPHKLVDLIDACDAVLAGKKVPELKPHFNDFNVEAVRLEGNQWEFSGLIDIIDASTVRVLELPPDLSLEKFKDRLNDYEDNDKIRGYIDKSTDQINVTIDFKRGAVKDMSKGDILDYLKLKTKKTERIVVIDWNNTSIRQYDNPESLVKDFVKWRLDWYKVRYQTWLANAEEELNFYLALETCFQKKLPDMIRSLKNKQEVKDKVDIITKKFKLKDEQLEKIVILPSYRWTKEGLQEVEAKIKEIEGNISEYKSILRDENKLKKVYRNELEILRKLKIDHD
jgi:DNA gyrase/topoisomerase IV subunit A